MENRVEKYSDITPDMIRDWKAKYGEDALSEVSVCLNPGRDESEPERTAKFVLTVPSKNVMIALGSTTKDQDKANDLLLANTLLGGDMEAFEKYGSVYAEVLVAATAKMRTKPATVKKL